MTLVAKDTYELTRAIISVIETGVVIGKELLFPGTGDENRWNKAKKRGTLRKTIKRLENQRLVSWEEIDGEIKLVLTDKGKKKTLQYKLDDLKIKKTPAWDGFFRVIIFDIPESRKGAREMLRKKLKELEFQQLQKSVFVTPYECRDEIDFIKNVYEIVPYVSYILATDIPDITFDIPKSK